MNKVIFLQSAPPKFDNIQKTIFNDEAVDFLYRLHKEFDVKIEQLFKERLQRTVSIQAVSTLNFKQSSERSDKTWKVAPLPSRLQ